MSLYYEAATVLTNPDKAGGSLKSRIYKKEDRKSSPAQVFALVTEASKWSLVLKEVIEKSGLLAEERKLTPILALLLTHDLLVSKNGIAAPTNHVLKLSINRHKARLTAEFTKARIRAGFSTLEALKNAINDEKLESQDTSRKIPLYPRWVRVNTIKTTLANQLLTTFAEYEEVRDLGQILSASSRSKVYFIDPNIPNLIALPPKADLGRSSAYAQGDIIFQDKASCFPAYLLDVKPVDGDVIDGCAAPGNKTTHLAAIISEKTSQTHPRSLSQNVIAFEKDKIRAVILEKMVNLASAEHIVSIKGGYDFLATNPDSPQFANVGAILLDPSCSGSGIVGRDDVIRMHLPDPQSGRSVGPKASKSRKRKRDQKKDHDSQLSPTIKLELDESIAEETPVNEDLNERLEALSTFQLRILTHAMCFPKAQKISYSTCSVHFEENENVVFRALGSTAATARGWKILKREHQIDGLMSWKKRGFWDNGKLGNDLGTSLEERQDVLNGCIRCEKGTEDGTMGFFVAAFVRDDASAQNGFKTNDVRPMPAPLDSYEEHDYEDDEEWDGFSD
ncbi:NOL1/NOP2/Sun domain family [Lindgomyces ingoldianus]|uniref:NOL1/NOP2/Sun domain family n=1 Tax=Lindgomyces ingoldianus TaxID=673940 RepID=A0ACB6QHG4_9PLEO|nr:NOL1/NOP2/Sun domain family [Lindgomyces ingoldianus]KAF2466429.1 NOL1/NOP2/Sun domain family [Lindgomyces ingoldianus]